jgi:hypothetical protein
MNAIRSLNNNPVRVLWLAVILALFTAGTYLLIARKLPGVGDLQLEKDGGVITRVEVHS